MASAWGGSWASAWGNSWGTIAAAEEVAGVRAGATGSFLGARRDEPVSAARDERKRDQIAEELKALYREIYEAAKPDSDEADKAAAVVAEYAPVTAPDFPPPDVIDWTLIASEGVATAAMLRNQLRDIQRELARISSEEDDIEVLLLASM